MKTKVIDIRKHDPEKVVAYWVSQGGNKGYEMHTDFPYVGIDKHGFVNGFVKLTKSYELIDLPESQDDSEEEFKTGDRVVDGVGSKGYFIGTLNGIHYYIADDIPYVCSTQTTTIKHHKEPELFEGWVNLYPGGELGGPHKTKKIAQEYGALDVRIIKVREVKDED
jgi:hypothetical protein